jgi:hypothetical protein
VNEVETDLLQVWTDVLQPDAQITLAGIARWLYHVFFLPGDYILFVTISHAPEIADFLGVSPVDHGGTLTGFLSLLIWLTVIVSARSVHNMIRRALRAWAFWISTVCLQIRIKMQLAKNLRQKMDTAYAPTEVQLAELETAVLRAVASLAPGHTLTAPDVTTVLRVLPSEAQHALDKLKELRLVDDTIGSVDGYIGYRITLMGEIFLRGSERAAKSNKARPALMRRFVT